MNVPQKGHPMRRTWKTLAAATLAGALLLGLAGAAAAQSSYPGFTLYSPENGTRTYLIDADHTLVHTWIHDRSGGYSAYLMDDGSVMRPSLSTGSSLNGGGAAGMVQRVSQTNTLLWQYSYSSNTVRTHHDIEPLPNGNVLLIAWERKTSAQAVQAGLDHTAEIWPDHIIEVQPVGASGGNIVWQWHAWDHLIQDHDATKDNYGVVSAHPELLDINLGDSGLGGDWMHINGISYNPERDEIVISSHTLDEIYVIDHSTTTAQAASHSGGNSGHGGDFLYRWGRPANYGAPGAQVFNVVHCGYWVPAGCPGAGHLMAFNNREGTNASMVVELEAPYDGNYNYTLVPGQAWGPAAPIWTYSASGFYSNHLGGCQRLPNGNTIVVESTSGIIWEVTAAGTVVWSYTTGVGIPRALRYGMNYPGLAALGLVETAVGDVAAAEVALRQNQPNPCNPRTTIRYELPATAHVKLAVYDTRGRQVAVLADEVAAAGSHAVTFDAGDLASGVYFYQLQAAGTVRTMKLVILK
jgi:hypothetical protein